MPRKPRFYLPWIPAHVIQRGKKEKGTDPFFKYDLEGNRSAVTDAAFHRSEQRYDVLDRLFESVDAWGKGVSTLFSCLF